MNQIEDGFKQVVIGIISAIIFNAILGTFAKDGSIPSGFVFGFTVVGIVGSILTIFSFQATGVVFTLGWIFGAWILKDTLAPFDFIV
jgi:hypothetical protein